MIIKKNGGVMKNALSFSPVFQQLSIPLTKDKQEELESSLLKNGCIDPIITWRGVIIDGYKRYLFCVDECIDYSVKEMSFRSEEEAVSWVCMRKIENYKKFSLPYEYLVGKLYIATKRLFREARKNSECDPGLRRTSNYVGNELDLHHSTVEMCGKLAAQLDRIAQKSEDLYTVIITETAKVTKKTIEAYSNMSGKRMNDLCRDVYHFDRSREKKTRRQKNNKIELTVRIKEMPEYDPDMELKGLMLTIPTWIVALARVEKKTSTATDIAKAQLTGTLYQLSEQIGKLLGVMEDG